MELLPATGEDDRIRRIATLKFDLSVAKLYEDVIRSTKGNVYEYQNAGIASAPRYARKTADAVLEKFQTIEERFTELYIEPYRNSALTAEDEVWLRERAQIIVLREYERATQNIRRLCSSFVGMNAQSSSSFLEGARAEAELMTSRLYDAITILALERKPSKQMTTTPAQSSMPVSPKWDVFISHASEDKAYVEPLVQKLEEAGIKVWFDKTTIEWGDDLRSTIDWGLKNCRYGIVVFSKAFLSKKKWTEYELSSLFALEDVGEKRILPIWHQVTADQMRQYSPAFSQRLAKVSERDDYDQIVRSLAGLLGVEVVPLTNSTDVQGRVVPPSTVARPNAIADANYETVGRDMQRINLIVRPSRYVPGEFVLETWIGISQEPATVFQGNREAVAMKYVMSDKELTLKGFKRTGAAVRSGDMAFNLS